MVTGRRNDISVVCFEVESGVYVGSVADLCFRITKIEMKSAAAARNGSCDRQSAMLVLKSLQALVTEMPRIYIENCQPGFRTANNADICVGPLYEPPVDLFLVDSCVTLPA